MLFYRFLMLSLLLISSETYAQTPARGTPSLADILGIPGLSPGTLPVMPAPGAGHRRGMSVAPLTAAPAPVLTEAQKTALREKQSTCFAPGRGNKEWEPRAGAAVVQVMMITPEGRSVGSGTVIRNSFQIAGGGNAILTAMHVVEGAATGAPGTAIGIVSTNGEPIGWAEVVARGNTGRERDRSIIRNFYRGDVAVLRIRGFVMNGESIFKAIEGVDVRPSLNTTVLRGEISNPAGTNPGISGAGALDEQGRIFGVVIRRAAQNNQEGVWKIKGIKKSYPDPMFTPSSNGTRINGDVTLPQSSETFVEPLLHPEVLAALGNAADDIRIQDAGEETLDTMMMGFPAGICVTYRGKLSPAR